MKDGTNLKRLLLAYTGTVYQETGWIKIFRKRQDPEHYKTDLKRSVQARYLPGHQDLLGICNGRLQELLEVSILGLALVT